MGYLFAPIAAEGWQQTQQRRVIPGKPSRPRSKERMRSARLCSMIARWIASRAEIRGEPSTM